MFRTSIFAALNIRDGSGLATARTASRFRCGGAALFEVEGGLITAGRLYLEDVEREWIDIEQAVQSLSGRRPHTDAG
jgi:hypothetical protein